MTVPPIQDPFNYQARHLQLLEWLCGQIDGGALGGGASAAEVQAAIDAATDIDTLIAGLAAVEAAQLDASGVSSAIDASADIEALKTSLATLASQAAVNGWGAQLKSTTPTLSNTSACSWTVPAGKEWWIQRAAVNFFSSSAVGDRQLRVRTWSGSSDGFFNFPNVLTASSSTWFSASPNAVVSTGVSSQSIPIPPNLVVPAAGTFAFMSVGVIDAGDSFQTPVLFYRERTV